MLEVIKPNQNDFNCWCLLYINTKTDIIEGVYKSLNISHTLTTLCIPFRTAIGNIKRVKHHYWELGSFYYLLKEYFRSFYGIYTNKTHSNEVEFYKIIKTIIYTYFSLPKTHSLIQNITFNDIDQTLTIRTITLKLGGTVLELEL